VSAFVQLRLQTVRDRGTLVVLQDVLPFDVHRAYWIGGADGQLRGGHRHRATRQALVAVAGRVTVSIDDGKHRAEVVLDSPSSCLLVEPEDWHTMFFEAGAVLLVFASHPFDPDDYIDEPYQRRGPA
jgi:hypothetical protein